MGLKANWLDKLAALKLWWHEEDMDLNPNQSLRKTNRVLNKFSDATKYR